MSYYANRDGLRCDWCLAQLTPSEIAQCSDAQLDLCDWCQDERRRERRSFFLTWAIVVAILGTALWVLYVLPPTFD